MTDFLLNECGDLDLTNGRVTIVDGADAVRQRWLIHIRTFLGEWFLDENIGVPYIQKLFRKQLSRQNVKQIFATASAAVPGILQVVSVIVNSLDARTRFCDVTVTCVIDAAEGPETGVFKFTGAIPVDGCGAISELPATLDGLVVWFDATDENKYEYDSASPPNLILWNKGGEGFAKNIPNGLSGEAKRVSASPINARPAVRLQNNPGGTAKDEALGIEGVPAIRDTCGYDGDITVFIVSKLNAGLASLPYQIPIWALDGVNAAGTIQEYYNAGMIRSSPIYNNPGNGGLVIDSEAVGTPATAVSATGTVTPSVQDDSSAFRAYRLEQLTPPNVQVTMCNNGATMIDMSVSTLAIRKLNGLGLLGAGYDNATGNPTDYFDGYIGEFIVFARALSDEELDAMNDYLSEKWGITKSV